MSATAPTVLPILKELLLEIPPEPPELMGLDVYLPLRLQTDEDYRPPANDLGGEGPGFVVGE